jgi:DNA helicase-2/ATP-dependent DNA helicase PcrA
LQSGQKRSLLPQNIIAFTFTEKAAAELKERIHDRYRKELGEIAGLAEIYVGMIHGWRINSLKTEVPKYSKFEVMSEMQQTLFTDRHSSKRSLTTSTDFKGKQLKRWRDTPIYVSALSMLRESALNKRPSEGLCHTSRHGS